MSDKLRTALKGGGRISILIDMQADGSFHIQVTEDWARLSRVEQAVLPAERLTAAEDPDALIRAEIAGLVGAVHINYEAAGRKGESSNDTQKNV